MREDPFGDLDLARFVGESRGGVRGEAASATTRFGDGLLRGLLRNARVDGIENPEYDHGGIPLDGQDGSCDDSVTSSNFNRRNLPILTSDPLNPVPTKLTFWTTADEIRTSYTLSPPLELCPAARGLGSRVTLGETDCVNYARLARAMWAATQ